MGDDPVTHEARAPEALDLARLDLAHRHRFEPTLVRGLPDLGPEKSANRRPLGIQVFLGIAAPSGFVRGHCPNQPLIGPRLSAYASRCRETPIRPPVLANPAVTD